MAEITLDHSGMAELLKSDEVRAFVTERAERVLSAAISDAPVVSGEYQSSLHIIQDTTDRVAVRVASDAPHAFVVEAATGNLARALDAAQWL